MCSSTLEIIGIPRAARSSLAIMLLILALALRALQILIFARVIISFVPAWQRTMWGWIIVKLTEPILAPFRGLRVNSGGVALDFSPMIVLIIISVVNRVLL